MQLTKYVHKYEKVHLAELKKDYNLLCQEIVEIAHPIKNEPFKKLEEGCGAIATFLLADCQPLVSVRIYANKLRSGSSLMMEISHLQERKKLPSQLEKLAQRNKLNIED